MPMRSRFMQMASAKPPMPPVTSAMRCAMWFSSDFFFGVASGRGFQRLLLAVAERLPRGDELAGVRPQPPRPFGPPASRQLLRSDEPLVRLRGLLRVHPVAALALRRRVDGPGDVAARAEDEDGLRSEAARTLVRAAPRHDVVLARGEDEGRELEALEAHRRIEHGERIGLAELVVLVGVAQVV